MILQLRRHVDCPTKNSMKRRTIASFTLISAACLVCFPALCQTDEPVHHEEHPTEHATNSTVMTAGMDTSDHDMTTSGMHRMPGMYGPYSMKREASGTAWQPEATLIDRQHPHDLFMELATTYSVAIDEQSSVFAYFGYPGEPALGPATFMHRFSGMDNPEAPITHHWLDSTHVTFGVATLGYIWKTLKADGSIFTGREPDENRWNFDRPRFDSYSARLTYNPTKAWSMQASYGNLHSPEELTPDTDVERVTASVSYHYAWNDNNW